MRMKTVTSNLSDVYHALTRMEKTDWDVWMTLHVGIPVCLRERAPASVLWQAVTDPGTDGVGHKAKDYVKLVHAQRHGNRLQLRHAVMVLRTSCYLICTWIT